MPPNPETPCAFFLGVHHVHRRAVAMLPSVTMDASFTLLGVYFHPSLQHPSLQPHFNWFNSPSRVLTLPKTAFVLFAVQSQNPPSASGVDIASFVHQEFSAFDTRSVIPLSRASSRNPTKRRSVPSDDPQALSDLPTAISRRVLGSRSPVRPFSMSNLLSSDMFPRQSHICSNTNRKIARDPWLLQSTKNKPHISLSSPS